MVMSPGLRKFALTAHVTASVGWFGAVVAFLPLAVVGLTSRDDQTVRAAYLAMEMVGWYALVPLAFASLVTGLVQAFGTRWLSGHSRGSVTTVLVATYSSTAASLGGGGDDPVAPAGQGGNGMHNQTAAPDAPVPAAGEQPNTCRV